MVIRLICVLYIWHWVLGKSQSRLDWDVNRNLNHVSDSIWDVKILIWNIAIRFVICFENFVIWFQKSREIAEIATIASPATSKYPAYCKFAFVLAKCYIIAIMAVCQKGTVSINAGDIQNYKNTALQLTSATTRPMLRLKFWPRGLNIPVSTTVEDISIAHRKGLSRAFLVYQGLFIQLYGVVLPASYS